MSCNSRFVQKISLLSKCNPESLQNSWKGTSLLYIVILSDLTHSKEITSYLSTLNASCSKLTSLSSFSILGNQRTCFQYCVCNCTIISKHDYCTIINDFIKSLLFKRKKKRTISCYKVPVSFQVAFHNLMKRASKTILLFIDQTFMIQGVDRFLQINEANLYNTLFIYFSSSISLYSTN